MKKNDFRELTIKLDTGIHNELESYLNSLNGIIGARVNRDESTVYVKYDCSMMNYNWIKLEILVFLKCNFPSILEFDKHSRNKNSKYEFVVGIDDYCCEDCLKSNIEYLLSIKGIEKVYSSFSSDESESIKISIYYDKNIITEQDLKNIHNIFADKVYVFDDLLNWNIEIQTTKCSSVKEKEFICFHFNTVNKRENHINVCIETNLNVQTLEDMALNQKINITHFITNFLIYYEKKLISSNINYDDENIILKKKSYNLYSLTVNFKIINLIFEKDFTLK